MAIDALDECPIEVRDRFFDLVFGRIEKDGRTAPYNFLFTSRTEPDIQTRMGELSVNAHAVPILTGSVNLDIRLHVARSIASHRIMKNWPKDLQSDIEETVANGAEGM